MSDARDFVLLIEKDKTAASEIASAVAEKLQTKRISLIDVVQSVGEFINDEDEKIRARAVAFLTAVIAALPPKFLSRQQIQVLGQFLSDRIEDGGAIEGLSYLQKSDRFTNEMAQIVARAIFEHFSNLQTRGVGFRHRTMQLLNELMTNHRKALRDMGDTSLVGVTDLVAGEKDPRNLMIVFSILRAILLEWDITKFAASMFDAVYVYFPITFRPPPNDPYGITAQDLKDRLRDCLSCSGLLAQWAIPCLLDKLDSTSPAVKKDVLQTLTACAANYDSNVMSQYSITLWDAIKYEVLSAQEPELADEALVTLRNITVCLSKSTNKSATSSPLAQYLKPVIKECLEKLQEPAQRQAKAAGDIMKSVSSADAEAFGMIVKAVIPPILVIQQSADGMLQQRAIMEVLNQLFESAVDVFGSWQSKSTDKSDVQHNLLIEFKDNFIAMYGQALMGTIKEEVSFRLTAAKGFLLLSKMRSFLEDNEIGLFVQYFNDLLLNEESYGRDELKKTALAGLAEISTSKPWLIMDITFPAFIARLPDSEDDAAKAKDYHAVLEGLAEIGVEKELQETLMRRLLNKLDILFRLPQSEAFPYTCSILSAIYYILSRSNEDNKTDNTRLDSYYDRVVVGLSKKAMDSASTGAGGPLSNETVLDLLGRIDNLIIRCSSPEKVLSVSENLYTLFSEETKYETASLIDKARKSPATLILSTWFLAAMPRDIQSSFFIVENITNVIETLVKFTRDLPTGMAQLACLRQIALYVNKHVPASALKNTDHLLSGIFSSITSPNTTRSSSSEVSIRLIFEFAKALVLRLAPNTNQLLSQLVSLLDSTRYDPETSKMAASSFGSILSPDIIVSKTNQVHIRLLAPQRVFQILTPLIAAKFKTASSSEEKQNYLTALSGVVATVPAEIVLPELPTILPLLLQSLDLSDQTVKGATLETLAVVITSSPQALQESGHIPALAKRLVASAALPKSSFKATGPSSLPKTRRLATRCLRLLPAHLSESGSGGPSPLLALKREVLQGLMNVLDDPRRDVRKEAVDARAAWIRGVDDPKNEDDEDGDDN